MRAYRIRKELARCDIGGFRLPLGVESVGLSRPQEGYTLEYNASENEDADSYSFHVVVSHEAVRSVLHAALTLLNGEIAPMIEVGSRDAYRSVDVFAAETGCTKREFMEVWAEYEPFLLEDATIGAGASCEDPAVEVFLDAWKGVSIHVPLEMRGEVELMFLGMGLREVAETWSLDVDRTLVQETRVRDVLEISDDQSPDLDELLLQLRECWSLDLDVDPEGNVDEVGKPLGFTLWHAIVIVEPEDGAPDLGAYVSIWSTATSMRQVEELVSDTLAGLPDWSFQSVYSIDRVAFDERPDELSELSLKRGAPSVHLVNVDVWGEGDDGFDGLDGNDPSEGPTEPSSRTVDGDIAPESETSDDIGPEAKE